MQVAGGGDWAARQCGRRGGCCEGTGGPHPAALYPGTMMVQGLCECAESTVSRAGLARPQCCDHVGGHTDIQCSSCPTHRPTHRPTHCQPCSRSTECTTYSQASSGQQPVKGPHHAAQTVSCLDMGAPMASCVYRVSQCSTCLSMYYPMVCTCMLAGPRHQQRQWARSGGPAAPCLPRCGSGCWQRRPRCKQTRSWFATGKLAVRDAVLWYVPTSVVAGQSAMQGNRGIEIANHWGPVDMDAELSAVRRAVFGHVAQYYTPPSGDAPGGAQGDRTHGDAQLAATLQQREADGQRAVPVRRRIPVKHALERKLLSRRGLKRARSDEERRDSMRARDFTANAFSTTIN